MSGWDNLPTTRVLTKELLTNAAVKMEQAIFTPDRIVVHPKMYNPLRLLMMGVHYNRRHDDLLPLTPRRPWWWRFRGLMKPQREKGASRAPISPLQYWREKA